MKIRFQLIFLAVVALLSIAVNCGLLGGSAAVSSQEATTPNYIEYFELGKLYYSDGNIDEAVSALQNSIIQNPEFTPAAEMLGMVFIDINDYDAALYQFSGVLIQNAYSVNSRLGKGRIHLLRNEYEQALDEYNIVLEVDPNNAESYFYRGVALRQLDEGFLSSTSFIRAILIDETYRQTVEGLIPLSEPRIANLFKMEYLEIERKETINRSDLAALLVSIIRNSAVYSMIIGTDRFQPPQMVDNAGREINFSDVPDDFWARDEIYTVVGSGLLELTPAYSFNPGLQVTRADLAQLLQIIFVRMLNDPGLSTRYFGQESPFTDLNSSHWSYNAARLITEHDLIPLDQPDIFGLSELVTGLQAINALEKVRKIFMPGE